MNHISSSKACIIIYLLSMACIIIIIIKQEQEKRDNNNAQSTTPNSKRREGASTPSAYAPTCISSSHHDQQCTLVHRSSLRSRHNLLVGSGLDHDRVRAHAPIGFDVACLPVPVGCPLWVQPVLVRPPVEIILVSNQRSSEGEDGSKEEIRKLT